MGEKREGGWQGPVHRVGLARRQIWSGGLCGGRYEEEAVPVLYGYTGMCLPLFCVEAMKSLSPDLEWHLAVRELGRGVLAQ